MQLAAGSLRWVVPPTVGGILLIPFTLIGSGVCALVAISVLVFHRDPDREIPDSGVVTPADGKVSVIRTEDDRVRMGIYMRGRDVHVNRAPMYGVVEEIEHEPGTHKLAFRKEAEANERQYIRFEDYTVVQIAGAFARRTQPYVEPGEYVSRGQRIGHISFSSRLDVLFPPEYDEADLTVACGDRVYAGETVIAPPRAAVESETLDQSQRASPG